MNRPFTEVVLIFVLSMFGALIAFGSHVMGRSDILLAFLIFFAFGIACRYAVPGCVKRIEARRQPTQVVER